ncbi:UvrD-helicase domain-containing protein [Bacillus sp. S/N-304-OC-R1]|uniref:UvrD-helicase domain-containing protein n=1 Tax=Bacillus sp. S/N-304-OC-R1 TaxID=2758034 RepID=UPI001C8E8802|nr:ATP-dependent helicase [Bacillus sp. S/N-304-OC-R1]MBY0120992.1 UvrD-helicase domain-containing protein [Bacillus sp. S/N-304-OC-R1]
MKTAKLNNNLIHVDRLPRETFQSIYENGKKGNLHCPDCGEKVRFYIGIEKPFHFYHMNNQNKKCKDVIDAPVDNSNKNVDYKEQNGFKIPVSRSITAIKDPEIPYKKTQTVKITVPFTAENQNQPIYPFDYLNELAKSGVLLDNEQANAVSRVDGPLLVLAGAGSGKTRVLTARTAFMICERGIDPKSIMLVTFTAKAAAEMKKRLASYPNMDTRKIQQIVSGTFHSLFYRILNHHAPDKWASNKLLSKSWQRDQLIKQAGRALNLDEKEFAYDLALQQISFWKNSLISPNEVRPESSWEEQAALLYKHYEETKSAEELFDFDDMLLGCYTLLKNDPGILELYQNRFKYFLIDEFQDINKVQYQLVKMMSAKTENVCAVGDDDQSIYAFRGSNPQFLLDFNKDFHNAETVKLSNNYRSGHEIVSTANLVIAQNKVRHVKNMHAMHSSKLSPVLFYPYDEEEEATAIVTDIHEKISEGFDPLDFAILFRTNTGSRAIFERLTNSSLPFRIDMDAESFYDRFIVKSMLSFLQLALNEDDQPAIKNILPALFVKQSVMKDLMAESILKDCSLLEGLKYIKTGFAFQEAKLKKVIKVTRSIARMSPLPAIEAIEKELNFQDFLKKRGNDGNKIEKGSDDLKDLKVAAKNFPSIIELLNHADHMRAMNKEMKEFSKKNHNAITLSTIHRSKGLEYKVVYILGAVDGGLPHEYALEASRNNDYSVIEEERRLMYVAITRAMEYLYISVPERRRGRLASPSRFLSSIQKQNLY